MEYFNLHDTLTHNAYFNFIIGHRSAGKTYAFKEWAIKDWKKTGKEWVYCRRYEDELVSKDTFFDDIAHKYGIEVKVHGWRAFAREMPPVDMPEKEAKKKYPWKPFGYFIPLAKQQKFKSTSLPNVNKLCLDEFIIENPRNKYIPDEVNQFLSLYFTIDRDRKEVRCLLLSNAGFINNPYFRAYDISARDLAKSKWIKRRNGLVLVHYFESKSNTKQLEESIIGQVSTKKYSEYALGNVFHDANDSFVIPKKPKNYTRFISVTDGQDVLDLYRDHSYDGENLIWVKYPGKGKNFISANPSRPIEGAPYHRNYINMLRRKTHTLQVTYSSPEARIVWYDMIKP